LKNILIGLSIVTFIVGCPKNESQSELQERSNTQQDAVANKPVPEQALKLPNPKIESCITALLNTKYPINRWEDGLKAKCLLLTESEQEEAATFASAKTNGEITFWRPSAVIGDFGRGRLPYATKSGGEEEERLALDGNYQAQRNYSFAISERNPVQSCAWRIVVIESGHKNADQTDISNLKVYCNKLDEVTIYAAQKQAKTLLSEINSRKTSSQK